MNNNKKYTKKKFYSPKSANPRPKRFKSFACRPVAWLVVSCKRCRPTAMPIGMACVAVAPAVFPKRI